MNVDILLPSWTIRFFYDFRFWDLLSDLCPTSVWRNGYLSSSFCLGAGRSVYLNGKVSINYGLISVFVIETQKY
jgi:hypothetical protein